MDIQVLDKSIQRIGNGWDYRTKGNNPISIIVHTTNGRKGSSYIAERNYIYSSSSISAHYLIGKEGQITQFLDTTVCRAWHAGAVNDPRYNNNNSIGIECHYTPGEGAWTVLMHQALTWLIRLLADKHKILHANLIETHRRVAIPKGRKIDPSGFEDAEFYMWRNRLFEVNIKPVTKYRVIVDVARVRQSPKIDPNNISGKVAKGFVFESEATKVDENMQYINGINTWAHLTRGTQNGIVLDGLGFIHTSNLTII